MNIRPMMGNQQMMPMQPSYPCCFIMPELAHAYVPFQCLDQVYPPMQGLKQGTIFPELDRPYGMDPEYTIDQ